MTVQESGLGGQSIPDHVVLKFAIDHGRAGCLGNIDHPAIDMRRTLAIPYHVLRGAPQGGSTITPRTESKTDSAAKRSSVLAGTKE